MAIFMLKTGIGSKSFFHMRYSAPKGYLGKYSRAPKEGLSLITPNVPQMTHCNLAAEKSLL